MKQVLVNTRCLNAKTTGVQRYTSELLKYLAENIDTIAPNTSCNGPCGHLWEQFTLPTKIKNRVLWSPSNTGPVLVKKQVVSIHDLATLEHPEWFSNVFARWYSFLLPRLVKNAKHIITMSNYTKDRIVDITKIPAGKISVIPEGVNERFFCDKDTHILDILKIPSDTYILALGSLEPRKNLSRLLIAWNKIKRKFSDNTWLVLAGAPGKSTIFNNPTLFKNQERIKFLGYVPDEYLPGLYANSLLFVYPSMYEGFGLPVLEAMASGAPVITSNVTSLPEVAGEAGLLVDPYDVDAIAEAIWVVGSNKHMRMQMRDRGLQRARQYSWEVCARDIYEIFKSQF